jgi:hypothetical protein
MAYSRKTISNAGDRVVLEKAEARESGQVLYASNERRTN